MALNRPRVDPKSGAKTSVVLGYYKVTIDGIYSSE